MHKYAIALKPVVAAGGIEGLDQSRKLIFQSALALIARLIETAQEVENVETTEDFNLIVSAKEDIGVSLQKLAGNAIITKIE